MTVCSDPRAIDAPDLLEPDRLVIIDMSQPARPYPVDMSRAAMHDSKP